MLAGLEDYLAKKRLRSGQTSKSVHISLKLHTRVKFAAATRVLNEWGFETNGSNTCNILKLISGNEKLLQKLTFSSHCYLYINNKYLL